MDRPGLAGRAAREATALPTAVTGEPASRTRRPHSRLARPAGRINSCVFVPSLCPPPLPRDVRAAIGASEARRVAGVGMVPWAPSTGGRAERATPKTPLVFAVLCEDLPPRSLAACAWREAWEGGKRGGQRRALSPVVCRLEKARPSPCPAARAPGAPRLRHTRAQRPSRRPHPALVRNRGAVGGRHRGGATARGGAPTTPLVAAGDEEGAARRGRSSSARAGSCRVSVSHGWTNGLGDSPEFSVRNRQPMRFSSSEEFDTYCCHGLAVAENLLHSGKKIG